MSRSPAKSKTALIPRERIEQRILLIRGQKVMLSQHLAELYAVPVKALNQAVQRNRERFPEDFMFQLDAAEFSVLKSQFVTSSATTLRKLMAPPRPPRREIGFHANR
jgi:hypothetical protein